MASTTYALATALGPTFGRLNQARKGAKRAQQEAEIRAAAENYENEALRNDLEAAREAAVAQERVAAERAVLAEQAENEAERQGQIVADAGDLDINIQRTSTQERSKRRRQFFEENL